MRRVKLRHGSVIKHRTGIMEIRVTTRTNVIPPELWEPIRDGKLAYPSSFSERGLHFLLKPYEIVTP